MDKCKIVQQLMIGILCDDSTGSKEAADLLALVCDVYCVLLFSHLVSWDRCGT